MIAKIFNSFELIVASREASHLLEPYIERIIIVEDVRSAVYYATGISAQTGKKAVVFVKGNNESRSAFSGLTEAYYRKLQILLVSLGGDLDYSSNLSDVGGVRIIDKTDLDGLDFESLILPSHIALLDQGCEKDEKNLIFLNELSQILTERDYLYISKNISFDSINIKAKVTRGGMKGCDDGAIANVLGASLSKVHERYFAIVTESEFVHDMNSLGNICYNDSIRLICLSMRKELRDYAASLGLRIVDSFFGLSEKKSVVFMNGEN